jgi:hemerythrin superfamily protein
MKEAIMPRRTSGGTASAKKTKKQASSDALTMLKEDHRKVEQLFEDVLTRHKQDAAAQIFKELEIHAVLEEELFYPALQQHADRGELAGLEQGDSEDEALDRAEMLEDEDAESDEDEETAEEIGEDVIASAYEDHQSVKELIQRLKSLDPGSADFQQGMVELQDMVRDHVSEEEEVMFPEARLKLDIKSLATQMQERKQELMSSMSA